MSTSFTEAWPLCKWYLHVLRSGQLQGGGDVPTIVLEMWNTHPDTLRLTRESKISFYAIFLENDDYTESNTSYDAPIKVLRSPSQEKHRRRKPALRILCRLAETYPNFCGISRNYFCLWVTACQVYKSQECAALGLLFFKIPATWYNLVVGVPHTPSDTIQMCLDRMRLERRGSDV